MPFGALALEFDRLWWAGEDEGAGLESFGRGFGEIFDRPAALGLGFVSGGVDEFLELGVGDLVSVDEEAADSDFVNGSFFGVVGEFGLLFGATSVRFPFDPDHAFG